MKTGNFTIALKFLKEIYLANPEQPGLFGRMAKCYFEIGDKVNALKFATDAVNTDSTKIENTLLYASIMARLSPEKKVRTLRYFELSLKLDAKKIELFDIYSNYLLSQNEIKRCIEICLMGKKIAPNNLNLNYTLGNCYLIQSDYYNAKPCFEIVVIQLPNDYSVQTILASCYLNTVPKVNAAFYKGYACIQNAIALNPNSGTTQLVYARYLQRLGQFAAAKEHYLKAKVLDSEVNDVNLENLLKM
jgi:tetratricopeptide (TPR) repeat protein